MVVTISSLLVLAACSSGGSDRSAPVETTRPAPTDLPAGDAIHKLEPVEFQRFMAEHPDVPVVNVHIPYENHITGTDAFVAFDEIARWDGLPDDLDAPIALYCRSGNMSGEASTTLAKLGYTDVTDLAGGMNAWSGAGLPLLDQDPAPN